MLGCFARNIQISWPKNTHRKYLHLNVRYAKILHFLMCLCVCVCVHAQACPTLCHPLDCNPAVSSVHGIFSGKNTGVGCHFLLQGVFLTQGWNPHLLHCRQIFYLLSHWGSTYCLIFYIKFLKICMTCVPNKMPLGLSLGAGLHKIKRTSRQNVLNYGAPPKLHMTHGHKF